jgi:hypothetical protein
VVGQAVDAQIDPSPLNPKTLVASTVNADFRDSSDWLRRTEKSEAVFKELAREPKFVVEGGDWTVVFNVFNIDGRVDRLRVAGHHDPEANLMRIRQVDIARVKPPGSFRWPFGR